MTLNITTIMRIKNIFMATLLGVMLHSCEFLDVVPDDTSTLDDAFKTETNAGNFIYGCYSVMQRSVGNYSRNDRFSALDFRMVLLSDSATM